MTDNRPLPTVSVPLADGTTAALRPIIPADAALVEQGFSELSETSRFSRFGMGLNSLSRQELAYLTDVDLVGHVAWGATIDNSAAGVGRYVVLPGGGAAEVAVTVVDRYQRLGLGTHLFQALTAVARIDGVAQFNFEIDPSNQPVQELLGQVVKEVAKSGLVHGEVPIADLPIGDRDQELVELMNGYRGSRGPGV
jgi:GNAT superfamily N-acetyltransferase